jgi:two-component system cell cycle response regulator
LDQRIVISQVLDFYDAIVTTASSGQEALRLLNDPANSYDVGLLDIRMPDMSGWQLLEEIRKHPVLTIREMPLIAVTANVMLGDRERVLSAGFTGYIPKPVEPTTLVQDILTILNLNKEKVNKL